MEPSGAFNKEIEIFTKKDNKLNEGLSCFMSKHLFENFYQAFDLLGFKYGVVGRVEYPDEDSSYFSVVFEFKPKNILDKPSGAVLYREFNSENRAYRYLAKELLYLFKSYTEFYNILTE